MSFYINFQLCIPAGSTVISHWPPQPNKGFYSATGVASQIRKDCNGNLYEWASAAKLISAANNKTSTLTCNMWQKHTLHKLLQFRMEFINLPQLLLYIYTNCHQVIIWTQSCDIAHMVAIYTNKPWVWKLKGSESEKGFTLNELS